MAEFVVDVGGGGDGLGDLSFDSFAEALAEAVDGDLEGAFAEAEFGGGGGLGGWGVAGDPGFEELELAGFAGIAKLGFKEGEGARDEGEGPLAIEEAFILGDGVGVVFEGNGVEATAALGGEGAIALVGGEVFDGAEEVAAEAATGGIGAAEGTGGEDAGEELVGEIAGGVFIPAADAEEGDDGGVVGGAEFAEGSPGGGIAAAGLEDEGPARGGERAHGSGWARRATKAGKSWGSLSFTLWMGRWVTAPSSPRMKTRPRRRWKRC